MKVLVIDDDPDLAEVISLCFEMRWPHTSMVPAVDGIEGISLVETENPDLVILDIGLPDLDGFEVCSEIRAFSDVPIIMLTGKHADTDVSRGLETGADDYVAKPFSHIELLSRVQAVLRRTQKLPLSKGEGVLSNGNLRIDFSSREVRVNGEVVKLTPNEYRLLHHFVRNAGRLLTFQTLLSKVWGEGFEYETYLLKPPIHNLRRKLGDDPRNPKRIVNKRGVGYIFVRAD